MNRGASKKNYQSITYNKWYYNLVNLWSAMEVLHQYSNSASKTVKLGK
jgi:hypothetical protein